jgi:hypothetical protein
MFNVGDFIFTTTAYAKFLTEPLCGFIVGIPSSTMILVVWINPPTNINFHGLGEGEPISYSMSTAAKYFTRG